MRTWYVLLYSYGSDYLEGRTPLREEHLRLLHEAHARGELTQAGAWDDPETGEYDGGALVFAVDDPAIVRRFAEADPYVKAGLVRGYRVRRWHVVVGA